MNSNSNLTRRLLLKGMLVLPASATIPSFTFAATTKPHFNTITIGHVDHGKSTLTAALVNVASNAKTVSYDKIDTAQVEQIRGIALAASRVNYETDKRSYTHVDCPGHSDYVKNLIAGETTIDGAILVVSLSDGPMPQTREHILLSRQVGIASLVVFLNKKDLVDDDNDELTERVELEVRKLLSEYDYPGNDVPIIHGSALNALEESTNAPTDIGIKSVQELLCKMDTYFPDPVKDIHKPFLMPIEDVFFIEGRGTIVTGRIEQGILQKGKALEVVGLTATQNTRANGVEMFRKLLEEGRAGQNVGISLEGVTKDKVSRGQVLAQPGTIKAYSKFEAEVYILAKDEGGRHTPFFRGYRPQFYFRTTDVTGTIELPEGLEMVMPGDNLKFKVELITPVAMDLGLRFAIREGGRTVGAGVVSSIYST